MGKIIGIVIAAIVGLTVLGFGIRVLLFPVHVLDKEIQTGYDTVDKTLNADNAIYNYEWFRQQKEDIDATKAKLGNSQMALKGFETSAGDRSKWTFEDKNEQARLNSVVLGIQNYLEQQIADYNARAKMANRNIFQDGLLPSFIDATTFILKN